MTIELRWWKWFYFQLPHLYHIKLSKLERSHTWLWSVNLAHTWKCDTHTSKHLDEVAENKKQLFNVHDVLGFQPQPISFSVLWQLWVRTAQLTTSTTACHTIIANTSTTTYHSASGVTTTVTTENLGFCQTNKNNTFSVTNF